MADSEPLVGGPERRARQRERQRHLDAQAAAEARRIENRRIALADTSPEKIRALLEAAPTHAALVKDQQIKLKLPSKVYNPKTRSMQDNVSAEHRIKSAVSLGALHAEQTTAVPVNPTLAWLKTVVTNAQRDEARKQQLVTYREGKQFVEDTAPEAFEGAVAAALAAATEAPPLPTDHTGREPSSGVPAYRGGYHGLHRLSPAEADAAQTAALDRYRDAASITPARFRNLVLHAGGLTTREIEARKPSGPDHSTIARWLKEDTAKLAALGRRLTNARLK